MTAEELLAAGRWADARQAYEDALVERETGAARHGLAVALWWLGEDEASVAACTRAYSALRRDGDVTGAVRCAIWLAITYKANFANEPAAAGWLARAERLLVALPEGPLHGWVWVARGYRLADLAQAEALTERALAVARDGDDTDLELTARSQLGFIRVAGGDDGGFADIDEAMAAALAGETSNLDVVVYACCDMLNACELANDGERAAQWCRVADDFVRTYGCPFLYAECRINYGSVLLATGQWPAAERELVVGREATAGSCPALHARATARLATLWVRQGRLEDAATLLGDAPVDPERALALAALRLARGDGPGARRALGRLVGATTAPAVVDVLVDALIATGDVDSATSAVTGLAAAAGTRQARAAEADGRGRLAGARHDVAAARMALEDAVDAWTALGLPYEAARARARLAEVLRAADPALAAEHARRALDAFDELGATPDADRAAALLRALGVTPRPGAKGAGLLTAREQEVLRLLGAGLSNPEIAARLYISRKTAAHHVSRILAKLALRNRAEAAAYAATGWAS